MVAALCFVNPLANWIFDYFDMASPEDTENEDEEEEEGWN